MLGVKDIIAFCGRKAFEEAKKMPVSLLEEFDLSQDPVNNLLQVKASVSADAGEDYYDVHLCISADGNFILVGDCDCEDFEETFEPCRHVAFVLIQFMKRENTFVFKDGILLLKRLTDDSLMSLMREVAAVPRPSSCASHISLQPTITAVDETGKTVAVEFRVQAERGHSYVIKSLADFARLVQNHERMQYGKTLEFVHSVEIFEPACQPMVRFLVSLAEDKDMFTGAEKGAVYYNSFYTSTRRLGRTLTLKGRYLDLFMELAEDISLTADVIDHQMTVNVPFTITNGSADFEVSLFKDEEGLSVKGPRILYGEGFRYLFIFDPSRKRIIRTVKNERLLPVLNYFSKNENRSRFINNDDLPSFSRYLYPLLSAGMQIKNNGFDPYEYLPAKPVFSIYLDLREDDVITGELYAQYGETRHNVLDTTDEVSRDAEEEQYMKDFFMPWFNHEDTENMRMTLSEDDDMLFELLKDGIALMQEKAEVFVSERLKKMSVTSMHSMNVGISVVHDLLQLNLVSPDLSMDQISEVLNRYDRKKKFFRLKNGDFLNIDEKIEELENFAEMLSLTPAQIALGNVELPRFRAWSLEELQKDSEIAWSESEAYRQLIEKMKEAEEKDYVLPEGLNASLRPYQETGFRWLSSLYANGFGGLLSDEMGLGKTLQAIAFLGSIENRGRCLIVCPASLVYNWSNEIDRFLPSLPHRMITGLAPVRKQLLETSEENEVLITSYDLLKRDLPEYENMHFTCQIIDEAQYIKNSSTQASQAVKAINARFRIAMTGTPIENRLSELWSIFDYMMPGFFHSYRYFRDNFEAPIVKGDDADTEERLKKMITPFTLRRLKKDVLDDLPDKLEKVYYAPLEGEQKDLYTARVQALKASIGKQSDKEFKENKLQVLAELTRLRQLCCDPSLIYNNYAANSSKKEVCVDLIRNAVDGGHKILVFSQFTTMLDELTERLKEEGISYHLLTGSTSKEERNRLVESFADDDVPVFCISLKAGGTGLNLTAADIVIHYDPWWNTAVENQASDRAHRIGQTNVVTVYRLIMKDTIEERILKLQQEKSSLADRVLSGEGVSSAVLTREDLLELL